MQNVENKVVIITGASSGLRSVPGNAVYCGTKHLVRTMLDSFRKEAVSESTNIHTTTIYPGAVKTELLNTIAPSETKAMVEKFYEEAGLTPDVIADAVLYALSQPDNVNVSDLVVRPSKEAGGKRKTGTMKEQYLFEKMPVPKAVATLAIPTIISQVVTVIYNLADIFFVGQIGDPLTVAAVSLVSPWFNLLTALGNLFGLGGSFCSHVFCRRHIVCRSVSLPSVLPEYSGCT